MLKDIKLPEPLLEFIESTKQRLLAEVGTEYVTYGVELMWTDMVRPSYTTITLYAYGSGRDTWIDKCLRIVHELDYEFLFDYVPEPFVAIECRSKRDKAE